MPIKYDHYDVHEHLYSESTANCDSPPDLVLCHLSRETKDFQYNKQRDHTLNQISLPDQIETEPTHHESSNDIMRIIFPMVKKVLQLSSDFHGDRVT